MVTRGFLQGESLTLSYRLRGERGEKNEKGKTKNEKGLGLVNG
jgi:hypothetical protein